MDGDGIIEESIVRSPGTPRPIPAKYRAKPKEDVQNVNDDDTDME